MTFAVTAKPRCATIVGGGTEKRFLTPTVPLVSSSSIQPYRSPQVRIEPIDIAVDDAGGLRPSIGGLFRPFEPVPGADWLETWEFNVLSVVHVAKALAPRMEARGCANAPVEIEQVVRDSPEQSK